MTGKEETFTWLVQPGIYASLWTLTRQGEGGNLQAAMLSVTSTWTPAVSPIRRYAPFGEHTGLFRTFSDTDPTPAGIDRFANRFGMLLSARPSLAMREKVPGLLRRPDRGRRPRRARRALRIL